MRSILSSASGSAIDLPLAALAALSVGFVAIVMPGDLLAGAVQATGLPALLPAAAPPLGLTARALIAAAAGGFVFVGVFMLLRLLGGNRAFRQAGADVDEGAPRLRRRDFHPDARVRRPISAERDLGEPRITAFSVDQEDEEPFDLGWSSDPAPVEPDEEPLELGWSDEAESLEPMKLAEPLAEDAAEAVLPTESPFPEPAAEAAFAPEAAPEPAPIPSPAPVSVHVPDPVPVPAPCPPKAPAEENDIASLMARLERGLASRRAAPAPSAPPSAGEPAPVAAAEPAPVAAAEPAQDPLGLSDDRLRGAIEQLQRLAARQP